MNDGAGTTLKPDSADQVCPSREDISIVYNEARVLNADEVRFRPQERGRWILT